MGIRWRARLAGAVALALVAATTGEAQEPGKVYRIGFVGFQSPGLEAAGMLIPFQARLRALGWEEDRNVTTAYRWADGEIASYPKIIAELVRSDLDVMVIPCGPPLRAVRMLKARLPVVARCIDLKDFGREIETPGRPGGYTTGATYFSPGAIGRRLELLREAVPGLSLVAVLSRPGSDWTAHSADIEAEARRIGLRLYRADWGSAGDLREAFDQAVQHRAGALLTLGDGMTHFHRHHLFALAADRRLPVLYDFPMFPAAEDVGFMAYYAEVATVFRKVAEQVDQILKGRKPGDIPIAEPEKFRFVISARAARALGLSIPQSLRQRADQVIE